VYVPFEKLEEVFENQERGVFLPYREFLELWNKLQLPEKLKHTEPPVEGVLGSAQYEGRVEGDAAVLTAKLSFEALKEGWSRVIIGAGELSVASVSSAALLHFANGGYEVLFPQKGSYQLEATIYGRVMRDAGRSSLKLKLPKTAVSQFAITVPDKGLEFAITPASAFTTTEAPAGGTRLLAYFGASEEVTISWTKKTGETALQPLLFADAALDVRIGAGAVRTDVAVNYRILRSAVNAFEVLVPADQQVLSVEGENVREWKLDPAAGAQRLRVDLHTPAKDTYALRIKLEAALPPLPQQAKLPLVQAQNVERQSGSVSVSADPEVVVEMSALEGLTQQAAAVAAEKSAPTGLVGSFRYLRLPYAGSVAVSEAKPQIEVTSETLFVIDTDVAQLRAKFDYVVKKSGIFAAQIEIPAGFTNVEATGEQIESSAVSEIEGRSMLNIKFTGRRTGSFSFQVTAETARAKADEPVSVPVFHPQNIERHEAKIGLAIHVSLKANTTDKGDLREEDIRNLGALPIPHPTATPLTLGFRYRGAAKPAQVQFELRKPRVSAEVLALVEVREALLRHTWTIAYNVEYAGVSELAVEVPKAIADDLQIDGANIKERIKVENQNADGQPSGTVTWRVVLQDKVLGSYELKLTHDDARADAKPGAVTPVAIHEIKALNVFRETGQVAVIKDGNLEFTKTDPTGLELIDPKELRPVLQRDGIFLAYKYATHPVALRLDVSKNLYLDVPQAVVSYAVLTSVIAEDEAETTEVIYWVRNNSQQFFSVQLPEKGGKAARLLSDAFVAGQAQQPSKRPDKNELLIRLPARQAENNDAFPVRFVYEVPSPSAGRRFGWRGSFDIQPPQLADVAVLQTRWTLYLPPDQRYVKFGGSMREEVGPRGWEGFWDLFSLFVPQIGPQRPGSGWPEQTEPPTLPAANKGGFDTHIQKEGTSVTLRRLAAPAPVSVSYRGKTYAATIEAALCALAFFVGVSLLRASRQMRFAYFMVVGVGALIVAGAVDPRAAGKWQAIYLGVFLALIIWVVLGTWRGVTGWRGRWRARREARFAARVPRNAYPPPPASFHPAPPTAAPTGEGSVEAQASSSSAAPLAPQ